MKEIDKNIYIVGRNMATERSDIFTVNLDDLIDKITKNTIDYINDTNTPAYDDESKYMEIYYYVNGAEPAYEMILKVGYLELNEKTDVPVFTVIKNILEEAGNDKTEVGWRKILYLTKSKVELTKNTGIKFNISLYGVKETITLNIIELYNDIDSSFMINKDEKYVLFTSMFRGAGNVYYSLIKSIGLDWHEDPIPILKSVLDLDKLYWSGKLPPEEAWDEIGEMMRMLK
jgi:hypothetical protein